MKFKIRFSEIIRYREFEVEAEDLSEAYNKFYDMDNTYLEKTIGISDVETENLEITPTE